jgi:hypothetical protein
LGVNKSNLLNIQADTFSANKRTENIQVDTFSANKRTENTQATSRINIAHLNIRSLRNRSHFLEARDLVTSRNIDVFTVSESWLNTSVKNAEIEGYKLHRLDRLHKTGGGALMRNKPIFVLRDLKTCAEGTLLNNIIQELNLTKLINSTLFKVIYCSQCYQSTMWMTNSLS